MKTTLKIWSWEIPHSLLTLLRVLIDKVLELNAKRPTWNRRTFLMIFKRAFCIYCLLKGFQKRLSPSYCHYKCVQPCHTNIPLILIQFRAGDNFTLNLSSHYTYLVLNKSYPNESFNWVEKNVCKHVRILFYAFFAAFNFSCLVRISWTNREKCWEH